MDDDSGLTPVVRLNADVRRAAADMGREAGRYLVDLYYELQEHRKALDNQIRALGESDEPNLALSHFATETGKLERQMKSVLGSWSERFEVGRWSLDQYGIGPVLSAGLLAHIDITRAPTVGSIWKFAGFAPPHTYQWGKGEKRPWNATLKTLCWKVGDSFVKFSGSDECYYGRLYVERKKYEVDRDEAGGNAETAARTLEEKNIKDKATLERYEAGRLPDGRLDLRARRWAVKLFLAHWHEVAYEEHYGTRPPNPYPIEHLGHVHKIERRA